MQALADEMPRIRALECMDEVNVLQVGNGKMKRSNAQQAIARWKRLARGGARRAVTRDEWQGALAATGIGLQVVPPKAAGASPDGGDTRPRDA